MNIFIGFGYNNDDKWIKELIFPLVESFDCDITTGEDLHGEIISLEVTERIKKADGVLTFHTRRDALASGKYTTHRWVNDELVTAINHKIPAVEIREKLVDPQGGLPGDRQRIEFELDDKASLMVQIAKVMANWKRKNKSKRLVLIPREIVQDARPHINNGNLRCTYKFMVGSRESLEQETKPFRFGQGLCVDVSNLPAEDALVQITLKGPDFLWSSDYESIQLISINLQKD